MNIHAFRTGLLALSTCLMLTGAATDLTAQTSQPPLTIRYVDQILERGDIELASRLIAPGAVLSTPEGRFLGPTGVAAFTAVLEESFSNIDFRIDGTQYDDDDLLIEFTLTGTQFGTYLGVPGRCASINVPGTVLLNLDDGMVDSQWINYDRAEIVRQADRFNQLASAEGITCASTAQLLVDRGADTATHLAAEEPAVPTATMATNELDGSNADCIPTQPCPLP